jgi:hypothetical protein
MHTNTGKSRRKEYHLRDIGVIWEDNIKMDLKETGCVGVDWFHLAQDNVQYGSHVNLRVT